MNGKIHVVKNESLNKNISCNFEGIIGQQSVLNKLQFFIETHSSLTPFPNMVFTGSHGLGKSYIARKISNSLNRKFIEINCGNINSDKDFVEDILLKQAVGEEEVILFLDESHELSKEITTILLTLLNPSSSMINELHYKGWNLVYDMSKINVIFATTDAHKMFKPLLNRCERIYFESYSNEDLINMISMYCPNVHIVCDKMDISDACRGRGRDAFVLSQKINRYLIKNGTNILNEKGWDIIKNIFEIYPKGLNKQEVELMELISDNMPISSANLALMMMVNSDNIESEIEVRPRELGLIASTTRGRILADKGKKYIEENRKNN